MIKIKKHRLRTPHLGLKGSEVIGKALVSVILFLTGECIVLVRVQQAKQKAILGTTWTWVKWKCVEKHQVFFFFFCKRNTLAVQYCWYKNIGKGKKDDKLGHRVRQGFQLVELHSRLKLLAFIL